MQLNSSDETSVELRVPGYEFDNWLQISGRVTLPGGKSWAFREPCLDIWEARELGDWLLGVTAGTEPPFRGIGEPGGWLVFTEPNLGFRLKERTVGRVRIAVDFTGEVTPPWFGFGSYLVDLDLSAEEMAQAAESWMHDLAEFPERKRPMTALYSRASGLTWASATPEKRAAGTRALRWIERWRRVPEMSPNCHQQPTNAAISTR